MQPEPGAILKDAPGARWGNERAGRGDRGARQGDAIDPLRKNRTTFIIAHRLFVREADIVRFVDHGRIAEVGSFPDLRQSNGRFAALLLRASGILTDEDVRRSHTAA